MDTELHAATCDTLHRRYPLLGLARVHHTNKRAQPMSFADKPYLIPLYAMMNTLQDAAFCKAVQTGISEAFIQLVLQKAGWEDRICAYVLPQYKTSERFVADRVDPLLLRTHAYSMRLPGAEYGLEGAKGRGNLKRKRFGRRGSLLFLGSNTPSDFLEFSCDVAIVDEYDSCELRNVAKIKDRTRESDYAQVLRVSNPRIPGGGITKLWKEGTQARWHHRCGHCGQRQALDWFTHFVRRDDLDTWHVRDTERADDMNLGDIRPVCQRCSKPFDRVAEGALWVAAEPQRATASFHISRLDVLASRRDPQPIRNAFAEFVSAQGDTAKLTTFWAGFLGWAYEPSGSSVTDEMLDRASEGQLPMDYDGGDEYDEQVVTMGVDVGSVLNVRISVLEADETSRNGYRRRAVWVGATPGFDELYDLQRRYRVDVIAIDAFPETHAVKQLRDYYIAEGGCQVWLVQYHPRPRIGSDAFGMSMKYEEQVVQVDRTQLLDTTLDELAGGWSTLPSDVDTVLDFRRQMRSPKRRLNGTGTRYVWEEGSEPDHYRHADAYDRVALEIHDRSGSYHE